KNFRTGTMESFGLGYDALSAINPGLVYCSISAFGRTGPRKDGAGYEALMQAFSGIMSITGEPSGPPVRAGVSFLDLTTGIFSALGICNALLYRAKTGLGQRVDGSLLETAVTLLNYHAEGFLLTGNVPKALGSSHPSLAPYRNFRCRDGQWVFIAGANDRFWQRLVTALDLPALRDERFATNLGRVRHRDDLEKAVADAIRAYDREPLLQLPRAAGGEGAGARRRPGDAGEHGRAGDERPADRGAPDDRARASPQARRDPGDRHADQVLADAPWCSPARSAPGRAHRRSAGRMRVLRRGDRRAPGEKSDPIAPRRLPRDPRDSGFSSWPAASWRHLPRPSSIAGPTPRGSSTPRGPCPRPRRDPARPRPS